MTITHDFVNLKADSGDTTIARPSDWNADHVGNTFGWANVREYGAVGDNVANDTAAFQAAHDSGKTVFVPPGNYKLSTPVQFESGFQIVGQGSRRLMIEDTDNEPILWPTTCAFKSNDPVNVKTLVTIKGLSFQGGTTQVDFGMCHEVTVEDCEFRGFTVAGICHVLGEKNKYSRVRFDFTTDSTYGLGFGFEASVNYSGGLYAGNNTTTFFGSPDAWVDRTTMDSITFQSVGTSGTWTNAAWVGRIVSGIHATNFIWHGGQDDGKLLDFKVRLQTSTFDSFVIDNINYGAGTPTTGLDIAQMSNSTFINISPGFAGTVNCTRDFNIGAAFDATFIGCYATGDNSSSYGFYFSNNVDQRARLIGCSGAIYSAGANDLIKGEISLTGCYFATSNLFSGSEQLVDKNNQGMQHLFMADANGAIASTAADLWRFASGSGGYVLPFQIAANGPRVQGYVDIDEIADPAAPTSNIGRLYVRDNGSGKSQIVIRFPSGAVQVIATEP